MAKLRYPFISTTKMMMKPILNLFAALAISLSFVGCNSEAPLDNPQPAQESPLPAMAAETDDCVGLPTVPQWFNFIVHAPGAPQNNQGMDVNMAYYTFLGSVPEYRLNTSCECKITYFKLLFDYLPQDHNDIILRDVNGNPISFTGPDSQASGDYIEINKADISIGPNGGVHIGFLAEGDASPELLDGGGYCIIENVDAPKKHLDLPMTDPYVLMDYHADGEEFIVDTYMPLPSLVYPGP